MKVKNSTKELSPDATGSVVIEKTKGKSKKMKLKKKCCKNYKKSKKGKACKRCPKFNCDLLSSISAN